jgi:trehalose 6-phosphate synthase/phosphatase
LHGVFLTGEEIDNFYNGFCNDTLWPLFHYFPSFVSFKAQAWQAYKQVNEIYFKELEKILKPGDMVWIHDYQLMLLPRLLRERLKFPPAIGFFLHTPFPAFEIFRLLPTKWRTALLKGLLGANLVGFHTYDYAQYFNSCVQRILGYEIEAGTILTPDGRKVRVETLPMGVDFAKYHMAGEISEVKKQIKLLTNQGLKSQKIILSIDRLDYTKGILKRLMGFEQFLEKHPQFHGKTVLIMVVVPNRTSIERYQEMKRQIDEFVGHINGRFGSVDWTPVVYRYKAMGFNEIAALYSVAEVSLVTPLRDGMNLVAKEYVASRKDQSGVLVLSEMAGAAQELGEAVIVNPNHVEDIAEAIKDALEMPKEEQRANNQLMQVRLKRYDLKRWADEFLKALNEAYEEENTNSRGQLLTSLVKEKIIRSFHKSKNRLLLLDYDGTLTPFYKYPYLAKPTGELLEIIKKLSSFPKTQVVIISGRDKQTLENWFRDSKITLFAEHGVWLKKLEEAWQKPHAISNDWKEAVLPIMKTFVDRLPGSFLEEKEYSLVWHYRMANPELAFLRAKELVSNLMNMAANTEWQVMPGNKIVEVKNTGTDKGSAIGRLISDTKYDFILAAGDDATDEDLFKVLPKTSYTIKVGGSKSDAKFLAPTHKEVLDLLEDLTNMRKKTA